MCYMPIVLELAKLIVILIAPHLCFADKPCEGLHVALMLQILLTYLNDSLSDALQDFSSSWDIRATPAFFFLKNGQQVDKLVGANKPELEKKVQALADGS